jgi:hypothetical protein
MIGKLMSILSGLGFLIGIVVVSYGISLFLAKDIGKPRELTYQEGINEGFKQGAEWALKQSRSELPLPIPDADQVEPEKKNYLGTKQKERKQ